MNYAKKAMRLSVEIIYLLHLIDNKTLGKNFIYILINYLMHLAMKSY